ncbi:hypothetical protein [Methylobacter tundripaludum]|uniref:Uncharacterized protein n=1 Tax=Methylobacter tundripaludum (strain ATCC BAA-1195 / DSM 17260 / SV96) TaxID=697282 RepID=G3J108_METTV|nr:hypothetical protein [Methylobacter tundripaludum]EGW20880.1 hypothetical protein Mettu_4032 [Methylobacter tundripaludum SV96]
MKSEYALAVVPLEAALVVFGALVLAAIVVLLLASLKALFQAKSLSQAILKIPGINFTIKGSGFLVLFLVLFVLIVASYMALRVIPGSP